MERENLLWCVKRKHMNLGDHIKRSLSQQSLISSLKLGDHHKNQATLFTVEDTAVGGGSRGGGGCIWPPRSYTCSYCKRDFRSAQALGGHMNVHRRDRALLKQVTLYPPLDHYQDHHHQSQVHQDDHTSHSKSSVSTNPSQLSYTRTSVAHLSPSHGSISGFNKVISSNNHDKGEILSFKRCKKSVYHDHLTMLPLFFDEIKGSNLKRPSNFRANQALENLDLELRLGDPPNKVYK